jgi:hypothetical protein
MVKAKRSTAVGVFAVLIGLALAGCGGSGSPTSVPSGDYPDISIAESKSPMQLLRNTVVSRIPAEVVLSVGTTIDGSKACLHESKDPEGLIRRWDSSVDVNIKGGEVPNTQAIADAVVKTFTDEGWKSIDITGGEQDRRANLLTNSDSAAKSVSLGQIRIEAVVSHDGQTSFIHIDSLGPCVVTDGKDSAEVKDLGVS